MGFAIRFFNRIKLKIAGVLGGYLMIASMMYLNSRNKKAKFNIS